MRVGSFSLMLVAWLLIAGRAEAREVYGPEAGVVPFGMGRAYSAVADDWLSLYYNPAGLALVKKVDVQLFDLKLQSNSDLLKGFSNVGNLGKGSASSVASGLNKYFGQHVMGQANDITQITVPHFAAGINYDVQADFNLANLVYPTTQIRYTKDLTFIGGAAVSAGKRDDFRLGVSMKYMTRTGDTREVPVTDILNNKSAVTQRFSSSGSGVGADVGMQYRLPTPGRADFITALVWHDIGKTSFGTPQQQDAPQPIQDNLVAGLGIRLPIGGKQNRRKERRFGPQRSASSLSFAFDYTRLNTPWSQEDFGKHCHLGMNLDLPILSLQLGLNQTSLTAGTSIDLGLVRVALATYGEELGSYVGQNRDRRYLLSIGSTFGFGGFK